LLLFITFKSRLDFCEKNIENVTTNIHFKSGEVLEIHLVYFIRLKDLTEQHESIQIIKNKQGEMRISECSEGMHYEVKEYEKIFYEDCFYHLINMDNRFDSMKIRNGKTVSKHRFVWNEGNKEHKIKFNDYFEPGAWFTVKHDNLSMLDLWK